MRSHGRGSTISAISWRKSQLSGNLSRTRTNMCLPSSVGGGSVIDTAKTSNLFSVYGDADLMDFINAPVGKGKPIDKPLRPLIASKFSQSL